MSELPVSSIQFGIDAVLSLAVGAAGWVINVIRGENKELREEHKSFTRRHDDFVEDVHDKYARREDVRDSFEDLKTGMRRIEDKLDQLNRRP